MSSEIVILQSYREENMTPWLEACLQSVRTWAHLAGYSYRFLGDELLTMTTTAYRDKLSGRTPMITDLARLLWIRTVLAEGVQIAVWIDADTIVFAPRTLQIQLSQTCQFGRERWLQLDRTSKRRVYNNVHNGYAAFAQGCPVLAFLIDAIPRIVERADVDSVPAQFVGPKLLTSLHNTVGFDLHAGFGAVSPMLAEEILAGTFVNGTSVKGTGTPMYAANLCRSLEAEYDHTALIATLNRYSDGIVI